MKKILLAFFSLAFLFFTLVFLLGKSEVHAYDYYKNMDPRPCSKGGGTCPTGLESIYSERREQCVDTYDTFKQNPVTNHFWVDDPDIYAQGMADERAREFLDWVLNHGAVDNHPSLAFMWKVTRNLAFFGLMIIAAVMGLGFFISKRASFETNLKIWPSISKLGVSLLYIFFSFAVISVLIQFSEILMKFFLETLGGKDLFNIYFSGISEEKNYIGWIGCRDLNFKVQEAVQAELFLLKLTNVTYYVLGSMLILRKVLLWFLLFVSPFLAIIMPFVFIRNIGWVWIGVFFQWLFYGPLVAIFLGALRQIWHAGIPFIFDFSRVATKLGYVYPTGVNIIYGGPAQILNNDPLRNGNYVDTFVEYVITLIMLWAVIAFPWWLLRIFRDYCCDGINAAKNILMSMYDQMRGGPNPQHPAPGPTPANIGVSLKLPKDLETPIKLKLETVEEVKRTTTENITKSLNLSTNKLTDVASFETNKQVKETVSKNIEYLSNPTKAETPSERQKYMNIRTELFNRAIKNDQGAKQILSSISSSRLEQRQRRDTLLKSMPQVALATQLVSYKVKIPQEKVTSVTTSIINNFSLKESIIDTIAKEVKLQPQQVRTIFNSLLQNISQPITGIVDKISEETGLDKEKISSVIKTIARFILNDKETISSIAQKENIKPEEVEKLITTQIPVIAEPEKHIEEAVAIPPTVPLEEYENVKKMWQKQYELGEIPVSENIKSRKQWVEQDIVFITNTLNKLLSANNELRNQGLDDLGYILPIFLLNNLKGEELLVYLKAKLEAAKATDEIINREKAIEEKLKEKMDEEKVEVAAPKKKEEEKTMEMAQGLETDIPSEDKNKPPPQV